MPCSVWLVHAVFTYTEYSSQSLNNFCSHFHAVCTGLSFVKMHDFFQFLMLQPPLPKVVFHEDEDEDEEEEEEVFDVHAHAMMDELDFTLTIDAEINAVIRKSNASR
jgi:hypothetical protein